MRMTVRQFFESSAIPQSRGRKLGRGWAVVSLVVALAASLRAQADGAQRWAFSTLSSSSVGNIVSSPTVGPDGTVYIGVEIGTSGSVSASGRLFAINPNGSLKWSYPAPDWVDSAPAIAPDGTIYFGCWDGNVYALNPNGTKKWAFNAGAFVASSPALGSDGTIYIGSGGSSLYAINPDGTEKWNFPVADWIDSAPAIAPDGTIYFGSWDNNIYAVRPDGTEKWRYTTGDDVVGSPAIAADGTIYAGSRDLALYALTPSGALKWSVGTGDTLEASPALGADGTIYIPTTGGRLYAFNADGTERWRYPRADQAALSPLYSTPAVRADGTIVFGTSNNALYVLNADGTLKFKSALGDWADSSPVVTLDGSIYIGCSDKRLYAFTGTSPLSMTDWPQFHRDVQRTGRQSLGLVSGTTGRLINLSVLTNTGTGGAPLTVGFVVAGSASRTLLVRGVGPTLASFSVPGALSDPSITLFNKTGSIATNDDWGRATTAPQISDTAAAVGAFALPVGSLDAALLRDFPAGDYSVQVTGAGGAAGAVLMEAYDAGGGASARLINVSALSFVGTGTGILTTGFVVNQSTRAVLVRGIGPTLTAFGVPGVLANPRLQLFDGNVKLVAENDDWSTASNAATLASTAQAVGAFALVAGSQDSVLLLTLPPGAYTAQISGVNDTTGVGLVEVYEVP